MTTTAIIITITQEEIRIMILETTTLPVEEGRVVVEEEEVVVEGVVVVVEGEVGIDIHHIHIIIRDIVISNISFDCILSFSIPILTVFLL